MVGYIQAWTVRAPISPKQRVYPTTYISWSVRLTQIMRQVVGTYIGSVADKIGKFRT